MEGAGGDHCGQHPGEVPWNAGQHASLGKTLEWSHDRRREGRGSSARRRPWRRGGGVLLASEGGDLLNRQWGMEAPSSLRRASCRPLLLSTTSTLGRHALVGEAATDRRARQRTDGGEVEGSTWRARTPRASVRARPREGARGLGRRGGVQRARALWRARARATSRPA
jgi:hypothetical protein